jgi:hypothetical protein
VSAIIGGRFFGYSTALVPFYFFPVGLGKTFFGKTISLGLGISKV